MAKALCYAAVMIAMIFGAFAAHRGDVAETIWFCSFIYLGLYFARDGE